MLISKVLVIVNLFLFFDRVNGNSYGLLAHCPGSMNPMKMTESYLEKYLFFKVQVNSNPTYTRRYSYGKASQLMGQDPNLDFRNRKTLVYMGGYLESTSFMQTRFLLMMTYPGDKYNIIYVDTFATYGRVFPLAARSVSQVGEVTAKLLHTLGQSGLNSSNIEVMGYSLGGQAASYVCKHYKKITGMKVSSLTTLDPTGPCFRNVLPDQRISPSDAEFVQVIHATGQGFGNDIAMGHVDFYINGGDNQYILDPYKPFCLEACGHMTVLAHYLSSNMNPDKFLALKCNTVQDAKNHNCYKHNIGNNYNRSYNYLGPNVNKDMHGIFYVPVTAYFPFYPDKKAIENGIDYTLIYDDAMSDKENIVLS